MKILPLLSLLACLCVLGGSAASAAPKLNVLFIVTDDWQPEIGCDSASGMKVLLKQLPQ